MARKDLAAILVEEKILAARDVERLERERVASRKPLWSLLVEAELATDEELFFLLAQRWQVATEATLEKVTVPEGAQRVWSAKDAHAAGLLPIELEGNRATAVMVDPSDEDSLAELLSRLQINEARVWLGRRSQIERAIERLYGEDKTPTKSSKAKAPPPSPPRQRSKTEPKVQIDPQLAEELQRMGPRAMEADALTPAPRMRRRRPTTPGNNAADAPPFTLEDALRAEEKLSRALLQAVEVLARLLEEQLAAGRTDESGRVSQLQSAEMARLSRRVARKLGLDRRSADEVGAAAYLFAVDRKLRHVPESQARAADWFGEIGWSGANEEGLLTVLRSLTANAAGFSRTGAPPPLGARIITVVDDYLQLGAAIGDIEDLGTVSQVLRASPAGAPVVDALLRVLESERVNDPTPATTVTATSVLHPPAPDEPSAPGLQIVEDKTQRKAAPAAPPPAAPVPRARREKE